jgi:hypothetical protein
MLYVEIEQSDPCEPYNSQSTRKMRRTTIQLCDNCRCVYFDTEMYAVEPKAELLACFKQTSALSFACVVCGLSSRPDSALIPHWMTLVRAFLELYKYCAPHS